MGIRQYCLGLGESIEHRGRGRARYQHGYIDGEEVSDEGGVGVGECLVCVQVGQERSEPIPILRVVGAGVEKDVV